MRDEEPGRIVRRAAAAAVMLAVAAGCGGGEARPMLVTGGEMFFNAPERVQAGTYEVTFQNIGTIHHELAFRNPDGEVATRRSIPPGQTVTFPVELESGTWELACHEPGHHEGGMHSELVVED